MPNGLIVIGGKEDKTIYFINPDGTIHAKFSDPKYSWGSQRGAKLMANGMIAVDVSLTVIDIIEMSESKK